MKFLWTLCIFCRLSLPTAALDREAFTFTHYDLEARIEPDQQRLGVRGKITLRNDSDSPQKNAALQISSTLNWSAIRIAGKPAQFLTQTYTSDIDHTGALSEAIVTFPEPIRPKQTIELEIGYEGVIPQDATRLTRIGVPADVAKHSDWDQISRNFTALRGIGYVAWYPIATEAANLSEPSSVSQTVGRWKQRERGTEMKFNFSVNTEVRIDLPNEKADAAHPSVICNGPMPEQISGPRGLNGNCRFLMTNTGVPLFVIGNYQRMDKRTVQIFYMPEHKSGADDYELAIEQVAPKVSSWFGDHRDTPTTKADVIELPDREWSPFASGNMLLLPLTADDTTMLLSAVRQLTHLYFPSPREWIAGGLAAYAQANYFLSEKGPDAAVAYLQTHRSALVQAEKENLARTGHPAAESSLINSPDEFYVEAKSMNVWWMLHDIVGDTAFAAALHNYNPHDDNRADYMQKLIEAHAHRDLSWFFDDWVYRDSGLPDFRVVSVYPRQLAAGGYMVTVTVENLGTAAAEVPVTLKMAATEASDKVVVPARSTASIRIQTPALPQEAVVNDGSVPETDTSNNTFRISAEAK